MRDLASIFGPPSTALISALSARLELEEWRPGSFVEIISIMIMTITFDNGDYLDDDGDDGD